MPTIPMGNFGQSVVQPGRAPRVGGVNPGQITGKALADLGQGVQQMAAQQLAEETKAGVEAYNRDAQTTAARVRITTSNNVDEAADLLAQDIKTGKVAKDKAAEEWQARHAAVTNGALDGVDERYKGTIQAEIEGLVQRRTGVIRQALTVRDQEDTRANLSTLGEEYQRLAIKDRPKAMAEYFAQIDAMGPAAGWGADDIAKVKQGFREGTAYTQAYGVARGAQTISQVRAAQKALASEDFADLSPQKRIELDVFLTGKEGALIQRAEHAANAAARAQEAHLNRARAEFEASQGRWMTGIPDNDEQLQKTVQALSGTPYMDAYRGQQMQARVLGGFASKTIPQQQREVDALYAERSKFGGGDQINERIKLAEKALSASKSEAQDDTLRAYVRRTPGEAVQPMNFANVAEATQSVMQRLEVARRAQVWAGRAVSPLTNDEALTLGQMLGALPVQQRSSALAALGESLGSSASDGLAAQIDKQDKALALALHFGASKTTLGRYTSELILKGQQAIKDKSIKVDSIAESGWRGQIAKEVGDAYTSEGQANAVKEAAYLITAGLALEGEVDPKRAVRLAAGGSIVEHNGRRIPLPAQVSQGDFEDRLRSLTPENFKAQTPGGVVKVGAQSVPVDEFVKTLPDSQLISVGNGRFTPVVGMRPVTNSEGRPIIITARP